ncbi:hypothetical protein SAMN06265222_101754 [Neorhodopirellula lusitana]|uniref:Uncharacterized protein n=1 Tax=Neorhodopirellula lusitana TaxID=445327 RepID=A0ABY1PQX9_9BACT|nr:hypothetical protein SAMN06265222_101754 [Neorhodopirellula lusitana]
MMISTSLVVVGPATDFIGPSIASRLRFMAVKFAFQTNEDGVVQYLRSVWRCQIREFHEVGIGLGNLLCQESLAPY